MDQGLAMVIGMSIAYVASFIGLGLAWWAWRRRVEGDDGSGKAPGDGPTPGSPERARHDAETGGVAESRREDPPGGPPRPDDPEGAAP